MHTKAVRRSGKQPASCRWWCHSSCARRSESTVSAIGNNQGDNCTRLPPLLLIIRLLVGQVYLCVCVGGWTMASLFCARRAQSNLLKNKSGNAANNISPLTCLKVIKDRCERAALPARLVGLASSTSCVQAERNLLSSSAL